MSSYTTARVHLWDHQVGILAESTEGEIVFEYTKDFQKSGLEISPINLPLRTSGPQVFRELRRISAFEGLPGVFADSLPDAFGNKVIRRYFSEKGEGSRITPVQKLLYVGDRGAGALTYHPAKMGEAGTEKILEVRDLVEQARRVIEGDTTGAVNEIMRIGATAGGARAKALILWDRELNRVRSGHATPAPGEMPWIIKFDGVTKESGGQSNVVTGEAGNWGKVEYVYSVLAKRAGINMPETYLLRDGNLAHFMVQRFDRTGDLGVDRIHMHSLAGMLHLDYNDQYRTGYEDYFDLMRELGLGQDEVNEAYRRMVFSVATVNYDDHLKNFAFLMDKTGKWSLSPAYDVAYAENDGWTRQHQMSIGGAFKGITRRHLLEFGHEFDVAGGGAKIIDEVLDTVSDFPDEALEAGLGPDMIRAFDDRLRTEMDPLR
jgi:serine/threonine-protein kinase HipA